MTAVVRKIFGPAQDDNWCPGCHQQGLEPCEPHFCDLCEELGYESCKGPVQCTRCGERYCVNSASALRAGARALAQLRSYKAREGL